jgi:hypothetical protein
MDHVPHDSPLILVDFLLRASEYVQGREVALVDETKHLYQLDCFSFHLISLIWLGRCSGHASPLEVALRLHGCL